MDSPLIITRYAFSVRRFYLHELTLLPQSPPPEIVTEIANHCDEGADLLSLSLVSKTFQHGVLPYLYSDMVFATVERFLHAEALWRSSNFPATWSVVLPLGRRCRLLVKVIALKQPTATLTLT